MPICLESCEGTWKQGQYKKDVLSMLQRQVLATGDEEDVSVPVDLEAALET